MNIRNIIFITIFLAVAIVQTNGQHVVRRLGALLEFGGNDRALLEVGGDDSSFSMMPVATDAAAGASGSMSMMHMITDAAAGASDNKNTEAHATTETPRAIYMHHSKSPKGRKSGRSSKSINSLTGK